MDESPELRTLFHRLNNQLGIILAHAELLEAKAPDDVNRARAAQVVASTLDAMTTARAYRRARSWLSAMEELRGGAGSQWNPHVVDAALAVLSQEERVGALKPEAAAL